MPDVTIGRLLAAQSWYFLHALCKMPRPNLSLEIAAGVAERSARGTQEFLELYRRASPQQIQIVRYLMRLLHERQQAPSQRVDAEIKKLWKAIDSGRLGEIDLPRLH